MATQTQQTFKNHVRIVPLFHYVGLPILFINLLWKLYAAATGVSVDALMDVAVAFVLVVTLLFARVFALAAQDRVIRLEERQRFAALLPDDLKPRIAELTTDQIVALRFASDDEVPTLVRKVLDERIQDRKTIKQMIATWRPDYQRV